MADTERFDYKQAINQIKEVIESIQPPKQVLLVEDDPMDIKLSLPKFEDFNAIVTVAETAMDATEFLSKKHFDIVLFDLRMSIMDGEEFIGQSVGLYPKAKFILVTGYPTNPKIDAVMKAGARIMFPKPLERIHLETILPLKPKAGKVVSS